MSRIKAFTAEECTAISNEWMRRYTEDPSGFAQQFQSVGLFLAEQAAGHVPSYGERCTAYMDYLRKDMAAKAAASNVVALPTKVGRRKRAA